MSKLIKVCVLVTFLYACNLSSNNCNTKLFVKNIPNNRKDSSYKKLIEKIDRLANLENLENGYQDTQIRIGFSYSSNVEHLIILKKNNKKWVGALNTLNYVYGGKKDTLISIMRTSEDINPKSGWQKFTDSLYKLDIATLPDISSFPGYFVQHDGYWVTVEIADCKSYSVYSYVSLLAFANKFPPAKNVIAICKLIESELDFKCKIIHPE